MKTTLSTLFGLCMLIALTVLTSYSQSTQLNIQQTTTTTALAKGSSVYMPFKIEQNVPLTAEAPAGYKFVRFNTKDVKKAETLYRKWYGTTDGFTLEKFNATTITVRENVVPCQCGSDWLPSLWYSVEGKRGTCNDCPSAAEGGTCTLKK